MNKISCDICMDLLPLVIDDVASEDSKNAVLEHIESCDKCKLSYTANEKPDMDTTRVVLNIKKQLFFLAVALMLVGAAFGVSIADGGLMFYNIIIMPAIGIVSYLALKRKSIYVAAFVFVCTYLRWLPDSFAYIYDGKFFEAFIPPLFWAFIYLGLFALGILIGFLLHFGFRKESSYEKEN